MRQLDENALVELYLQSELFTGLTGDELKILTSHGEYVHYEEGTAIVSNAAVAGHVYVIHEGDVVISRRGDDLGDDAVVARFLSGECFGELDLFSAQSSPVSVSASAETGLVIFPAAGHSVGRLFAEHPAIGSRVLKNLLSMVARRIRSTNRLISHRSPWVQELRRQVFIDKLTGLYNKTWLLEELERELVHRISGTAVLVIKPDNFKTINDTFGHDAGDKTLALLGESIGRLAQGHGVPARHGGDVFATVCNSANARQFRLLANRIVRRIRKVDLAPIIGPGALHLTVSVGIAVRRRGSDEPIPTVIQKAFDRMLVAREAGGDRICDTGASDE
jgi:diguanylate cyclase